MPRPKYYLGVPPTACELCAQPITTAFIDGATMRGGWANMCPGCWVKGNPALGLCGLGGALGIGRGQRYDLQPDGKWLKTEG